MDEGGFMWGCGGLIAIVVLIVGGVWLFDLNPFSDDDEITLYLLTCDEAKMVDGGCPKSALRPRKRTVAMLFSDSGEIIYWNRVKERYVKLSNCVIADRKNWSCDLPEEIRPALHLTINVQDGVMVGGAEWRKIGLYPVSRWRYWYWKVTRLFGGTPAY